MKRKTAITIILSLCLSYAAFSKAEPIIIANTNFSENELDSNTIKQIYLGKKTKWDDGSRIVPVCLMQGKIHEDFLETFVKKDSDQYTNYWKLKIFTGQGVPPKSVKTQKEMIQLITSQDGAIGYVDSTTSLEGVKVIKTR